ncbi:hypothetical protein GGR44_000499 [Sphingobium fontiphilum]|uniref:Lipoprotein n=1 Tax=Sphingobium fontiphilum TaxID=944425 RepID=A0A7W6GN25_9SPHN|nr:hypothetical protein [Sphingobium fontiphilum]MBB3980868.1 hypothetical protein [Sphingobium fontiphilum]
MTLVRTMAAAMLALAVVGCAKDDKDGNAAAPSNTAAANASPANEAAPVAAPEGDNAANAAAPGEASGSDPESAMYGDCYLKVDGKVYIDIKKDCPMFPLNDGKGGLIVNSDGEELLGDYFAYLQPNGDGTASASWNEEKGATHAQAPLSETLKRDGACWYDKRVRICATKR